MIKCTYCGSATSPVKGVERMFATGVEFVYNMCLGCGHTQLAEPPRDMAPYYPANYYSLKKKTRLAHVLSFRRSLSMRAVLRIPGVQRGQYILDYGAGRGDFVYEMHRYGYKNTWGYDPYVESKPLVHTRWHLITLNHVVEHLGDPVETLMELKHHLLPGGQIMLRLPVIDSYAYQKYGSHWSGFDAPRHINLFTRQSVGFLAEMLDMDLKSMYDDSSHFQFTASNLYQQGQPLSAHTVLSRALGALQHTRFANHLNGMGYGDQVVVLLKLKA